MASFVSAKRLFRGLSKSNSKLVKHRAQSAVREFMSAVWPSISEGFPSNSQLCFMVHFLNFARSFGVYNFLRGKASVYVEIKLLRKEIILLWTYERKEILIRCKQKRFSSKHHCLQGMYFPVQKGVVTWLFVSVKDIYYSIHWQESYQMDIYFVRLHLNSLDCIHHSFLLNL